MYEECLYLLGENEEKEEYHIKEVIKQVYLSIAMYDLTSFFMGLLKTDYSNSLRLVVQY